MSALLSILGSLTGLLGIIIAFIVGVTRLTGNYYLAGFELQSLFLAGISLLVAGCFLKLEALNRE